MVFYLSLLTMAILFSVLEMAHPENERFKRWMVHISAFCAVILAGFRKEIGGDWYSYMRYHEHALYVPFSEYIQLNDPGYLVPGWIFARLGAGVWAVNVMCVALLVLGTTRLAFTVKYCNLFYLCTVPYLLIVVGMGYSRQSAAIGMASLVVSHVFNQRTKGTFLAGFLALSLHKSAVFGLMPVVLAFGKKIWHTVAILVLSLPVVALFAVLEGIEEAQKVYINKEYNSAGALIRTLQVFLCGAWFLAMMRKHEDMHRTRLLIIMAILSLLALPAVLISPSSTLIDRFVLYLLPFQCYVLARTPEAFSRGLNRSVAYFFVIMINSSIFMVWMRSAANLSDWLPYKNFLWSFDS